MAAPYETTLGQRAQGRHRGHVEDGALAAPGHGPPEGLAGVHGAHEIEVEHLPDGLIRQIEKGHLGRGGGLRAVAAGPVDQNIHLAVMLQHLPGGQVHGGRVGHIGLEAFYIAAVSAKLIRLRLGALQGQVDQGDARPQPRQRLHGRA